MASCRNSESWGVTSCLERYTAYEHDLLLEHAKVGASWTTTVRPGRAPRWARPPLIEVSMVAPGRRAFDRGVLVSGARIAGAASGVLAGPAGHTGRGPGGRRVEVCFIWKWGPYSRPKTEASTSSECHIMEQSSSCDPAGFFKRRASTDANALEAQP